MLRSQTWWTWAVSTNLRGALVGWHNGTVRQVGAIAAWTRRIRRPCGLDPRRRHQPQPSTLSLRAAAVRDGEARGRVRRDPTDSSWAFAAFRRHGARAGAVAVHRY